MYKYTKVSCVSEQMSIPKDEKKFLEVFTVAVLSALEVNYVAQFFS